MKNLSVILLLSPIFVFSFVAVSHSQYTHPQLTINDYCDAEPQISDNGWVVWHGGHGGHLTTTEIFLYNGEQTIQLTENDYNDTRAQINANGFLSPGLTITRRNAAASVNTIITLYSRSPRFEVYSSRIMPTIAVSRSHSIKLPSCPA